MSQALFSGSGAMLAVGTDGSKALALLLLLIAIVLGVVLLWVAWLLVVGAAALLFGLLLGTGVVAATGRRRHVAWTVPLLTIAAFLGLDRWLEWSTSVAGLIFDEPVLTTIFFWFTGLLSAGIASLIATAVITGASTATRVRGDRHTERASPPAETFPAGPAPVTAWQQFRRGLLTPVDGLIYLCRRPALVRYAVVPVLVNLLVTVIVLVLLLATAVWFAVQIHPWFPTGWWGWVLEVLAVLVLGLVAAGIALASWMLLNSILCGHFYGRLARQVEIEMGLPADEMRELPWKQRTADSVRAVLSVLGISAGLLLMNIVPVIGTVVAVIGGFYFNGMQFGREMLDFPLSLRGIRRDEKKVLTRKHRIEVIGLGDAVMLFYLVPVLGSVLSATAVIGAVRLHRKWQTETVAQTAPAPVATLVASA